MSHSAGKGKVKDKHSTVDSKKIKVGVRGVTRLTVCRTTTRPTPRSVKCEEVAWKMVVYI